MIGTQAGQAGGVGMVEYRGTGSRRSEVCLGGGLQERSRSVEVFGLTRRQGREPAATKGSGIERLESKERNLELALFRLRSSVVGRLADDH